MAKTQKCCMCSNTSLTNIKSSSGKTRKIKLHVFPKDSSLIDKWINTINNSHLKKLSKTTIRRSYFLCENHFEDSDYIYKYSPFKQKLNNNAIPRRNLGQEIEETSRPNPNDSTNQQEIEPVTGKSNY